MVSLVARLAVTAHSLTHSCVSDPITNNNGNAMSWHSIWIITYHDCFGNFTESVFFIIMVHCYNYRQYLGIAQNVIVTVRLYSTFSS